MAIVYEGNSEGFQLTNEDTGEWVDVEFTSDTALFLSYLDGDEKPVTGAIAHTGDEDKCVFAAMAMLGVISTNHLIF